MLKQFVANFVVGSVFLACIIGAASFMASPVSAPVKLVVGALVIVAQLAYLAAREQVESEQFEAHMDQLDQLADAQWEQLLKDYQHGQAPSPRPDTRNSN